MVRENVSEGHANASAARERLYQVKTEIQHQTVRPGDRAVRAHHGDCADHKYKVKSDQTESGCELTAVKTVSGINVPLTGNYENKTAASDSSTR